MVVDAFDLLDHQRDVPLWEVGERDESFGVLAAPFVDVPVVVRLEHPVGVLRVLPGALGEELAIELDEVGCMF